MRGSVLWILAVMAAWSAIRVTDGWSVPFAAFAFWVAALLLMSLITLLLQRLSPKASTAWHRALMVPGNDCAASVPVESFVDTTWHGEWGAPTLSSVVSQSVQTDGRPGWYTHLADFGIYYNERYPRQGICDSTTWLLRAGDVLLLRFVSDVEGGQTQHHCDFLGLDDAGYQSIDVRAKTELHLPIVKTGLYELGIGQCAYGSADYGTITAWLQVPDADRLSLSNDPQTLSGYHYSHRSDGALQVSITKEEESQQRARLGSSPMYALPVGAMLLFDPAATVWDDDSIADPTSEWLCEHRHQFRWYVQVRKGDVLAMEFIWRDEILDQRIDLGDATGFTGGQLEVTGFVSTPTLFSSSDGKGIERFVCEQDGFHFVELTMFGPREWRGQPSSRFIAFRLWGLRLQRPSAVRDFALALTWIEDWYERPVPVPHAVHARLTVGGGSSAYLSA